MKFKKGDTVRVIRVPGLQEESNPRFVGEPALIKDVSNQCYYAEVPETITKVIYFFSFNEEDVEAWETPMQTYFNIVRPTAL